MQKCGVLFGTITVIVYFAKHNIIAVELSNKWEEDNSSFMKYKVPNVYISYNYYISSHNYIHPFFWK